MSLRSVLQKENQINYLRQVIGFPLFATYGVDEEENYYNPYNECIDDNKKHFHPLRLCDEEQINYTFCLGCHGQLSKRPNYFSNGTSSKGSQSIYDCLQCQDFFHESCARLPSKIDSPFHPSCSLELGWSVVSIDGLFKTTICKGCNRPPVNRNIYECRREWCYFALCVECAFLRAPILKFESHEHLLTLFLSVNPLLRCDICDNKCDGSNIFRCIDCNYNLHLHCGPLPCSIKDKCHVDPLRLMYAFVEDGYEDDTVYCDVCERPRDPDECVYYCKDCNFFAELTCVKAEVLRSLNGERGNVKLRTANKTRIRVGAKLITNVITDNVETDSDNEIEDIGANYLEVKLHENTFSGSYTDKECEQLIEIFRKARVQLHPSRSILRKFNMQLRIPLFSRSQYELMRLDLDEESDNGENAIAEPLPEYDDFKQLMRNLDSSYYAKQELLQMFHQRDYNIVQIGEHTIVQDSAYVLKGLLHKYGDFTAKSKLSERLKAIFLTMFCEVIRSMCLTNVREVDEDLLRKWWKSLKLVQLAGFEIEFAIDQLNKIVQALCGMKAIKCYREMESQADKVSIEIVKEEVELKKKMRELEKKKRELEEFKSHVDELKHEIEYESSPIVKDCLKQVSELKWKKAWDGSPIMFR